MKDGVQVPWQILAMVAEDDEQRTAFAAEGQEVSYKRSGDDHIHAPPILLDLQINDFPGKPSESAKEIKGASN